MEIILPAARVNSHQEPVSGDITVHRPGTIILLWDNTYRYVLALSPSLLSFPLPGTSLPSLPPFLPSLCLTRPCPPSFPSFPLPGTSLPSLPPFLPPAWFLANVLSFLVAYQINSSSNNNNNCSSRSSSSYFRCCSCCCCCCCRCCLVIVVVIVTATHLTLPSLPPSLPSWFATKALSYSVHLRYPTGPTAERERGARARAVVAAAEKDIQKAEEKRRVVKEEAETLTGYVGKEGKVGRRNTQRQINGYPSPSLPPLPSLPFSSQARSPT